MNLDPYKVLRLRRAATEEQIKKAFRTLSMKWHPDRNPGNEKARGGFEKVAWAYSILGDKERRARYDATGDVSEPKTKDNERAEDVRILSMAFVAVVHKTLGEGKDPTKHDIMASVRQEIARPLEEHKKNLLRAQRDKIQFEKCLPRIVTAEPEQGEQNDLADAVRQHMREIESAIQQLIEKVEQGERLLKLVAKFKYNFDRDNPTAIWGYPGITFATSSSWGDAK